MRIEDYLTKYETLKNIKRFNMETVASPQNLSDHGHGVGTLFYLICKELEIPMSATALFIVSNHDFAEAYTSDINRRIKDKSLETKTAWGIIESNCLPGHLLGWTDDAIESTLTGRQLEIFKIADNLEALLYCLTEIKRGNRYMIKPASFYLTAVFSAIENRTETIFLKIISYLENTERELCLEI